jgi:predicted CoA-binding protein
MTLSEAEIRAILKSAKTIAVVGISPKEDRPSHWIAKYLVKQGYTVVGVRPGTDSLFGVPCYPSLKEIPESVDIVDVFRAPEHVPPIVDEAIEIKAKIVWLQEGISHPEAEAKALKAGLKVVSNRCIYKEHSTLVGKK